jgi:glycosyltransferase involved in cell wall biosynthesis
MTKQGKLSGSLVTPEVLRIGVAGLRGMPGVMGGIESHCEELYPRIVRRRPSGWILCAARAPYVPHGGEYQYAGVGIKPLPSTKSATVEALLNTTLAVLYFGLWRRPDILHIHAIGPAFLAPLAKLLGLKLVVTHHGRDYRRAKWNGFARLFLRTGERFALMFADKIIVVSETLAEQLRTEFPPAKHRIVYIPNGVADLGSAAFDEDDPLRRFGLTPGKFILSVGRLVPEKGFQDLIAAHLQSGIESPLVIAGGADHESDFVRSLRAKASDRIIFTGMMPRSQVGRLYAACGLFVLASRHEGLPIAALEAAASGAPLLLSDIDANLDVGLAAGNYFPVENIEALAARLREDASAFAIDRDEICRRFDWDSIADATLAVYATLK